MITNLVPVVASVMLLTNQVVLVPTDDVRATVVTAVQITPNMLLSVYPDKLTNSPCPAYFTNVISVVTNFEQRVWQKVPEHIARNPHETTNTTAGELRALLPIGFVPP